MLLTMSFGFAEPVEEAKFLNNDICIMWLSVQSMLGSYVKELHPALSE